MQAYATEAKHALQMPANVLRVDATFAGGYWRGLCPVQKNNACVISYCVHVSYFMHHY